jgi:hypothetical protein
MDNFPVIRRQTPIYRWNPYEPKPKISAKALLAIAFLLTIILAFCFGMAHAQDHTDEAICQAIWKAEGGVRATYAYGIRSVHYANISEARHICLRTIRNNRVRYARYGYQQYPTYLEFLASRYCPVQAHPKNRYWLRNVSYWLERGE